LGISASVQRHIGLQRVARPFMQTLADELDVSVALGARDRTGLVFLELVRQPRSPITINPDAGSVVPIERTSIGLAYLVAAPVSERVVMIEQLKERHPDDWDDWRLVIERAHMDYRKRGFVVSQRGRDGVISGVGVPLILPSVGVFSFACFGASAELSKSRLTNVLGPKLTEAVAEIDAAMKISAGAKP